MGPILACKRKSNVDIGWKSEVDPGPFATLHIHRMFLDNSVKIQRVELSLTMRPGWPPVEARQMSIRKRRPDPRNKLFWTAAILILYGLIASTGLISRLMGY